MHSKIFSSSGSGTDLLAPDSTTAPLVPLAIIEDGFQGYTGLQSSNPTCLKPWAMCLEYV